jgi:hypothetical protein
VILESNLNVVLFLSFTCKDKRTGIQYNLTEHFKARILLAVQSGSRHNNYKFLLHLALMSLIHYEPKSDFFPYTVLTDCFYNRERMCLLRRCLLNL